MPLTKLDLNIDPKIFEAHGVNIHEPNELKDRVTKRNERMTQLYNQQSKWQKVSAIWNKSLWASTPIEFTFKDWKPDERQNEAKARELGNKAFKLAKAMINGHLNVVMSGNAGVGKTSLALAMLDSLRKAGKTVMVVSTVALSQLISDQYEYNDRKEQLRELKRAMKECDVLLLDDLGADGGSAEKVMGKGYTGTRKDLQALMFEIANNRYEGTRKEQIAAKRAGKKLLKPVHETIITTNNLTTELERIYGERTVSRLISRDRNHRLAFNNMEDMRPKEGL